MDFQKAFVYFLSDKNWKKKYFIGAILLLPAVLSTVFNDFIRTSANPQNAQLLTVSIIVSLIGIVLSFFTSGYFAVNNNLRIYKKDAQLPEWSNWKIIFKTGMKTLGASILYGLIYFAFFFVSVLVVSIIIDVFFKSSAKAMLPILMGIGISISLIAFVIFVSAALIAFSTNLKFSSFFNLKLISSIVSKNKTKFFVFLLVNTGLYILSGVLNLLLIKTVILAVLAPFISFYISLVVSELLAQVVRCE